MCLSRRANTGRYFVPPLQSEATGLLGLPETSEQLGEAQLASTVSASPKWTLANIVVKMMRGTGRPPLVLSLSGSAFFGFS